MSTPTNKTCQTPLSKGGRREKKTSSRKSKELVKNVLNREVLRDHGISYDPHVIDFSTIDLPSHVKALRDSILSFEGFLIPEPVQEAFQTLPDHRDQGVPSYAYLPVESMERIGPHEQQVSRDFIKLARELSDRSVGLQKDIAEEDKWQDLFKDIVFKQLVEPAKNNRPVLSTSHADHIKCVSSGTVTWYKAQDERGLDGETKPKRPKPDGYLGFKIHATTTIQKDSLTKDKFFDNFTDRRIYPLMEHGLYATPTNGFGNDYTKSTSGKKSIPESDWLCFPCVILELKNGRKEGLKDRRRKGYCQAANAASASLNILENLAKFEKVQDRSQQVPPVVTITCVGEHCKAWLAFSCPSTTSVRNHKMMCIWKGHLGNLWDAIQFCRIVENTSFWAVDILRPQISRYIDQWRLLEDLEAPIENLKAKLNAFDIYHMANYLDLADLYETLDNLKNAVADKLEIERAAKYDAKEVHLASSRNTSSNTTSDKGLEPASILAEKFGNLALISMDSTSDLSVLAEPCTPAPLLAKLGLEVADRPVNKSGVHSQHQKRLSVHDTENLPPITAVGSVKDWPRFGSGKHGRDTNVFDSPKRPSLDILPQRDSGYNSSSDGILKAERADGNCFRNPSNQSSQPPDEDSRSKVVEFKTALEPSKNGTLTEANPSSPGLTILTSDTHSSIMSRSAHALSDISLRDEERHTFPPQQGEEEEPRQGHELKSLEPRLPSGQIGRNVATECHQYLKRVYIDQPTGGRWVWVSVSLEDGAVMDKSILSHSSVSETGVLLEKSIQYSPKALVFDSIACTDPALGE